MQLRATSLRAIGNRRRGGGAAPAFDISTLYAAGIFHWDASDATTITEAAGEATQLRDKSGNGNHLNFSVSGRRPLVGEAINGVAAIDCRPDKYGLHTENVSLINSAQEEFWVLWSEIAAGQNGYLTTVGGSSTSRRELMVAKTSLGSGTLPGSLVTVGPVVRRTLIQHSRLSADGLTQSMYIDGRLRSGATTTSAVSMGSALGVFASSTGTTPANCVFGERFVARRELTSDERANVINYLTNKWRSVTPVTKYHIVLLTGQSNMRGAWGPINRTSDVTHPRIAMLERTYNASTGVVVEDANGPIVLAEHPLSNRWRDAASPPANDSVGPGLAYAKELLATLPAGEGVLLVPCAQGSTYATASPPLSPDVTWHPSPTGGRSNAPYLDTIARANRMIADGHELHSILWCQGESDAAVAGTTQASHAANMDAILGGLRAGITGASSLPLVVIDIPDFLVAGTYVKAAEVKAAIADTTARLTNTAFVSTDGMTDGGDSLHYDAASARAIGAAAWTAYGTI